MECRVESFKDRVQVRKSRERQTSLVGVPDTSGVWSHLGIQLRDQRNLWEGNVSPVCWAPAPPWLLQHNDSQGRNESLQL